MKYHLITAACLFAAVVFYVLGFAMPGNALIVAGVVAELAFWIRLAKGKPGPDAP